MDRRAKRNYFFLYTVLFCALALAVYSPFLISGKTLIKRNDSFVQHYRALAYYGEYLRSILRELLEHHRLTLPEWDFSIGFGSNILTTFHYYVIGDPLALLSVFVPQKYTLYLQEFLIVLRNYLAGITFSCFCFGMKKTNRTAVLCGAFVYVFCGYAMKLGLYHPFFLNVMIYFPLVLLGAEKIFRRERPYLFILAVFLSAVSNFYFFYMTALLTAVYVAVRQIFLCGKGGARAAVRTVLAIGGYALTGFLMSAFLLVPVILAYLRDYRLDVGHALDWHYAASYYARLFSSFVGAAAPDDNTMLTYGAAVFFAVLLLFLKKGGEQRRQLKIFFVMGSLVFLFPRAGSVLNGFSYAANRWSWCYSLLAGYILVSVWEELFLAGRRQVWILAALAAVYALGCAFYPETFWTTVAPLPCVLGVIAYAAYRPGTPDAGSVACGVPGASARRVSGRAAVMAALVLAGIVLNAYQMYLGREAGLMPKFYTEKKIERLQKKGAEAVAKKLQEKDGTFFRYAGSAVQENAAMNSGTHNMQFYWSLSNGNIARFLVDMEVLAWGLYYYSGQDDRTFLDTLAGCRYYINNAGDPILPYGYREIQDKKNYTVYENDYALPLAYVYDSCLTPDQLAGMNGAQKSEAMMQSVILQEETGFVPREEQADISGSELDFQIAGTSGAVEAREGAFLVPEGGGSVELLVDGAPDGENYLGIRGFSYQGDAVETAVEIEWENEGEDAGSKLMRYRTPRSSWPTGLENYMINLGYSGKKLGRVRLTFRQAGEYRFDRLFLWHQPMEVYRRAVAERDAANWEGTTGTDSVKGRVNLQEDGILLLAVPYDGGWTARVDGEEREVLQANIMFCGLEVPAGAHEIELVYHTPGLRAGCAASLAGLALLLVIILTRFYGGRRGAKRIVRKKIQYFKKNPCHR